MENSKSAIRVGSYWKRIPQLPGTLSTQVLYSEAELRYAARKLGYIPRQTSTSRRTTDSAVQASQEQNKSLMQHGIPSVSIMNYYTNIHDTVRPDSPNTAVLFSKGEPFETNKKAGRKTESSATCEETDSIVSADNSEDLPFTWENYGKETTPSAGKRIYFESGLPSVIEKEFHGRSVPKSSQMERIRMESIASNTPSIVHYLAEQDTTIPERFSTAVLFSERDLQETSERLRNLRVSAQLQAEEGNESSSQSCSVRESFATIRDHRTSDVYLNERPSLAVLYSKMEIEDTAQKISKLLKKQQLPELETTSFSYPDIYKTSKQTPSPSIVVMYSEKEISDTRKKHKIPSQAPESDIFTFGTVSDSFSQMGYKESGEQTKDVEEVKEEENVEEEEELLSVSLSPLSLSSGLSGYSGWELIGCSPEHWNEVLRPGNGMLDYYNLELYEEEAQGVLTHRIIATGLSCLDTCPGSKKYVYTKLDLGGKKLKDILLLQFYRYLQCINLSWNLLADDSALGNIRYLIFLDISHNYMTTILKFRAPWFLTYVNYSYNSIKEINDLSHFWSIKVLDLSNNQISKIEGLQNLRYLQVLDLSKNMITVLENLSSLPVIELHLEGNMIHDFSENLSSLLNLRYLNLNDNELESLGFLQDVSSLRYLEMKNNKLSQLYELENMRNMTALEGVDFTGNEITQWPSYREAVISELPSLTLLDGFQITIEEKINAKNCFDPEVEITAAWKHAQLLLTEQLNNPLIGLEVIPVDQPHYPMLVLVGPPSSGKFYLKRKLMEMFGEKLYIGIHHTTHEPVHVGVHESLEEYWLSQEEWNKRRKHGEFLSISTHMGYCYGFSHSEFAKAVKMGCICVASMCLPEALQLFASGIQPCLILTMTQSKALQITRLVEDFFHNYPQVVNLLRLRDRMAGHKESNKIAQHIIEETLSIVMKKSENATCVAKISEGSSFQPSKRVTSTRRSRSSGSDKQGSKDSNIGEKFSMERNFESGIVEMSEGDMKILSSDRKVNDNFGSSISKNEDIEAVRRSIFSEANLKADTSLDDTKNKTIKEITSGRSKIIEQILYMNQNSMHASNKNLKSSNFISSLLSETGLAIMTSESDKINDDIQEVGNYGYSHKNKSFECPPRHLSVKFNSFGPSQTHEKNIKVGSSVHPQSQEKNARVESFGYPQNCEKNINKPMKPNGKQSELEKEETNKIGYDKNMAASSNGVRGMCKENIQSEGAGSNTFETSKYTEGRILNATKASMTEENKGNATDNSVTGRLIDGSLGLISKSKLDTQSEGIINRNNLVANAVSLQSNMGNASFSVLAPRSTELSFGDSSGITEVTEGSGKYSFHQPGSCAYLNCEASFNYSPSNASRKTTSKCEENIIKLGLQYRNAYLRVHHQHPGLFQCVIYTDDLDKAACQLKTFLKECLSQPMKHPVHSPEKDPMYQEVVTSRLYKLNEEMDRRKYIMAQQQNEIQQFRN